MTLKYTVRFFDGDQLLASQTVAKGAAATAPQAPSKEGYVFKAWDKDFSDIEDSIDVHAEYEAAPEDSTDSQPASADDQPASAAPADSYLEKGEKRTVGKARYIVTGKGTVRYSKYLGSKKKKSITVPSKVKISGKTYKVTAIGASAFAKSKAKTIKVGANVKTIAKKAFAKSAATKLTIVSKKLSKKRVSGALVNSKVKTVKAPKSKKKAYKTIFKKSNSGKKVIVK